jgi:hypothetical protein
MDVLFPDSIYVYILVLIVYYSFTTWTHLGKLSKGYVEKGTDILLQGPGCEKMRNEQ